MSFDAVGIAGWSAPARAAHLRAAGGEEGDEQPDVEEIEQPVAVEIDAEVAGEEERRELADVEEVEDSVTVEGGLAA